MVNDPFSVLGVSSSATEDEIKSAYRKLAKKYHPDVHPGDKTAEAKMREINEAYSEALKIKKDGGSYNPYGSSSSAWGNPYGNQSYGSQSSYGSSQSSWQNTGGYGGYGGAGGQGSQGGDPFGGFGFDPFEAFFGGGAAHQQSTRFRTRNYANPELKTAENHILAQRYHDALSLLNRIPLHDADWHALYARADLGLGNRISAMDHARQAAQMAPGDTDYQTLLRTVESDRQTYQQSQRTGGYDFRSAICSNPCLTCCAMNMVLNCCLGGRYWLCC